jgi:hypothetical protein
VAVASKTGGDTPTGTSGHPTAAALADATAGTKAA